MSSLSRLKQVKKTHCRFRLAQLGKADEVTQTLQGIDYYTISFGCQFLLRLNSVISDRGNLELIFCHILS